MYKIIILLLFQWFKLFIYSSWLRVNYLSFHFFTDLWSSNNSLLYICLYIHNLIYTCIYVCTYVHSTMYTLHIYIYTTFFCLWHFHIHTGMPLIRILIILCLFFVWWILSIFQWYNDRWWHFFARKWNKLIMQSHTQTWWWSCFLSSSSKHSFCSGDMSSLYLK